MNCPRCGAASTIHEVVPDINETLRRRRVCARGHRFLTYEVHQATFTPNNRRLRQVAETIKVRVAMWRRDQFVLAEIHKGWEHIAEKLGLSRSSVFQAARRARAERVRIEGYIQEQREQRKRARK